jgi:predicted Zn-dependent protease
MRIKFLFSVLLGASLVASAEGYKDGIEYFKADQFDNAKTILERNLNNAGTDKAVTYYYLGAIALHNNDKATAKANFDKGVQANAECPYNYVGLGNIELTNGNKSAAEANFKTAQNLSKKNAEITVLIARAYYNADPVKYTKEISSYLAKARKDSKNQEPSIYILEGDMDMAEKKVGDAAAKYENAIYYEEGNSEGYVKYANAYFQVNPDYAVRKLEELLTKQPNSALAQRELAEKYYENNQWLKASDQYGEYIKNPNHFPEDKARYAVLLYYGEKYTQSLQVSEEMLAQDADNFLMNRIKFLNLAALGRNDEAVSAAEVFFTKKGYFTGNDYVTYADVLTKVDRKDDAVAQVEKAVAADPENEALLSKLTEAYTNSNRHAEAAATMDKYISVKENPTATDYSMAAGRYLIAASSMTDLAERKATANKGVTYIDRALEVAPNNAGLWQRKGQLILVGNNNEMSEESATVMKKVLSILDADASNKDANNPSNQLKIYKSAYTLLGIYYNNNKDKENASLYFGKLLEVDPTNESAKGYFNK